MTLNCAAYAAEIVRGGVQSIGPGQIEAGRALGMHTADIYRFIVFRPAIRAVYPALCSQFILLMLNSSLVSSVSAEELTLFRPDAGFPRRSEASRSISRSASSTSCCRSSFPSPSALSAGSIFPIRQSEAVR
ncbi:ABC transporter permease subunit (plasmid) [Neorhizobium galegae]|nr:ABC transporter permease subunit [Neorhizobium galegae]